MLELKTLNPSSLKGREKNHYKQLLEKKYRGCLSGQDPYFILGSKLICIGAAEEKNPVGIAVGAFRPQPLYTELYNLQVALTAPYDEVAAGLLQKFEELAREMGSTSIKTIYPREKSEASAFEHLLQKQGWNKGNLVLLRAYFDVKTFSPPWLHREHPVKKDCSFFMWKDLKIDEREHLKNLVEQKAIPYQISPFIRENSIDWNTSIGLRNKAGVIGWMINSAPRRNLIEFRSFFIFPEYYMLGYSMLLLTHSISLVQKDPERQAFLEICIEISDNRWIKFVKNRLLPYAESVERFYESWKNL